jgi:chromate transporter
MLAVAVTVPFREAFRFWLKLGFVNFGGPAGQIALMHEEIVTRRRWLDEPRFLHALSFCMLLPGPEAQQLAVYTGWLLHGVRGGLAAGILFVLPAFFLILALSGLYALHGRLSAVEAVFYGLRAAVLAILVVAVTRMAARALVRPGSGALAAAAFVAIFALGVPFPWIVAGAALAGLLFARLWPMAWAGGEESTAAPARGAAPPEVTLSEAALAPPSVRRTLRTVAAGLLAWWAPLLLVVLLFGTGHILARQAVFFSQTAMVTFGGAYAVLAYIHQAAVQGFGWITAAEMLDGLGLAESTPGPLIMVTEFVGFLAAFHRPEGLPPVLAGVLGALVTTWATFAPCFLWIFAGAPYIERLRANVALRAALAAVTAAVVGVILNLAVWFALHTLFTSVQQATVAGLTLPVAQASAFDPFASAIALVGALGLWKRGWAMLPVILGSVAAGLLRLTAGS